ncbi:hypothetical protein [Adhaeribacter terreus]|uniref:DUF4595 domain-containing protein n=1 Tax=Adhaeribacter terreus TaxID=529703 RepID=A0ABW0ECJ2_9BACT
MEKHHIPMISSCFLFLAICAVLGFSSCSDNDSKDPEPEAKKTFTGCRLVKIVNPATNSLTEYFYNSNNNIVKETSGEISGGIGTYKLYNYDVKGRIISSRYHIHLGSPDTSSQLSIYQYNNADMLISKRTYNGPNYAALSTENKYFYDASGKVDSSWAFVVLNGVAKPQWLYTYDYDNKGNLTKKHHVSVKSDNGLMFTLQGTEQYLNHDNFKTPLGQKYFTLRQLNPERLFTLNSPTIMISPSEDQEILTHTYRADSLLAETKYANHNYSIEYIYDCN